MDISYNSQVYILQLTVSSFQKITWMMLSYICFHFLFHQIRLYELFFRNSQIFCIFSNLLPEYFRSTSTTVPTSAAVIICKQLFMKFLNCSSNSFSSALHLKMYEIQYFHFPFLSINFTFLGAIILSPHFSHLLLTLSLFTQLCPVKFISAHIDRLQNNNPDFLSIKLLLKFVSKACLSFIIFFVIDIKEYIIRLIMYNISFYFFCQLFKFVDVLVHFASMIA